MKKKLGFLLIFIVLSDFIFGVDIVEQRIINQKKTYTIGDAIEYKIILKNNPGKPKIKDETVKDIEIINKYNKFDKNLIIIYRKYQLFNINIKRLPDIILENNKGEKRIIKGLKINMKSVLSKKDKKIEDIVSPMKGLDTGYSPLPLIISLIILLFLLIILYLLYKKFKNRKKKSKITKKIWEEKIDPIEYIKTEWGKISIENYLKSGKDKELFYILSEILKTFLSLYYKKNYIDMTSNELIKEFKKEQYSELSNDISNFLEQADLIKFAKKIPKKEEEIDYAVSFFNRLIKYYEKIKEKEERKPDIDHSN